MNKFGPFSEDSPTQNSPRFIKDVKYPLDLFHIYCYYSLIFALTLYQVTFQITPKQYQLNIQESKTNKTPQQHYAHIPCTHTLTLHFQNCWKSTEVRQHLNTWCHPSSAFPSYWHAHKHPHSCRRRWPEEASQLKDLAEWEEGQIQCFQQIHFFIQCSMQSQVSLPAQRREKKQ